MVSAIVISIVFALIFAILLMYVFNRRGPGPGSGLLFLFIILFMFSWVGGSRMEPAGPEYWGVSWLGYAAIAFFIMLLLAAILPSGPDRGKKLPKLTKEEVQADVAAQTAFSITFGFFFWLLVIILLILGLAGAFYSGPVESL